MWLSARREPVGLLPVRPLLLVQVLRYPLLRALLRRSRGLSFCLSRDLAQGFDLEAVRLVDKEGHNLIAHRTLALVE
jgi:hypothetical protein